jgi:DNA-directed RNA polymerase specialized sigma24 family protein
VEELELQKLQKTPGSMVAHRELLKMVRDRLNDQENEIAEHRLKGCSWDEISQKLGGTAEAIRKQFSRAIDRVTNELGVDESTYE